VAIADLNETEPAFVTVARHELTGRKHTATHYPNDARTCPSHTFKKTATLDFVTLFVLLFV
jgi:hypothetical protein